MKRTVYPIGAAIAAALFFVAFYFEYPAAPGSPWFPSTGPSTLGIPGASPVAPLKPPRTPPEGALEYRDTTYRFSLFYPKDLSVSKKDNGGGSTTLVLQDPEQGIGLQIFVVPYGFPTITDEQFKKDDLSGVRTNTQEITIDGVKAVSFFSQSALLGDTAEIWFIKDGYLFEITAPKTLAEWLSGVMASWEFI